MGLENIWKDIAALQFWFRHDKISDFYISPCLKTEGVENAKQLLLMRYWNLGGTIFITIFSKLSYWWLSMYSVWIIYLTNWGLVLVIMVAAFAVLVSKKAIAANCDIPTQNGRLPWYVVSYWMCYAAGWPLAFFSSILYWGNKFALGEPVDALGFMGHFFNVIFMMFDMFTSRAPYLLTHYYCAYFVCLVWYIFSYIYYLMGGTNLEGDPFIYAVLHWAKPYLSIFMMLLLSVMMVICHVIVYKLIKLRDSFYDGPDQKDMCKRCGKKQIKQSCRSPKECLCKMFGEASGSQPHQKRPCLCKSEPQCSVARPAIV